MVPCSILSDLSCLPSFLRPGFRSSYASGSLDMSSPWSNERFWSEVGTPNFSSMRVRSCERVHLSSTSTRSVPSLRCGGGGGGGGRGIRRKGRGEGTRAGFEWGGEDARVVGPRGVASGPSGFGIGMDAYLVRRRINIAAVTGSVSRLCPAPLRSDAVPAWSGLVGSWLFDVASKNACVALFAPQRRWRAGWWRFG